MKELPEGILWRERKRIFFGLPWTFTIYSCSEEILYIKRGFLNQTEDEVRLYRIMDISLKKKWWQRIFKIGTIHCCSGDKTMKDFDIANIKNVDEIKKQLSDLVEKQRIAKRVTNREFMVDDHDMDEDADLDSYNE
ncbi:MAG: PH domain-containing protein [Lachnospiraceae bacterium]